MRTVRVGTYDVNYGYRSLPIYAFAGRSYYNLIMVSSIAT